VSSGPAYYDAACQALAATCESYSFCKRASLVQTSALSPVRRLRHLGDHALLQQEVALWGGASQSDDDAAGGQPAASSPLAAGSSRGEL